MARLREPPDENAIAAMHKAWARVDLQRYLTRWPQARIPHVPERFWSYPWRAVDLGCGFGKYLIVQSRMRPERGFLGIDKGHLRGGGMVSRFQAADRPNLFGLHGNAIPILAALPPACLNALTIFYPNPWWPAKHRKKRWSYHPLLPHLTTLLKPGGTVVLTSNEAFYLREWIYAVSNHPAITGMELTYAGPVQQTEGRTHFEAKFMAETTPIGEVRFTRLPTPAATHKHDS